MNPPTQFLKMRVNRHAREMRAKEELVNEAFKALTAASFPEIVPSTNCMRMPPVILRQRDEPEIRT